MRTCAKAAFISGPFRAFSSRLIIAARYAVGLIPARDASNFWPSSGRVPPLAIGYVTPPAFIFSASSLNSAQVTGILLAFALSIARFDRNSMLVL